MSLGKCDGREGIYVPISREIPIPENKNNAPAYDQISIELHNAQWFVFFNGELLGDAAVADDGKNRILVKSYRSLCDYNGMLFFAVGVIFWKK